MTMETCIKYFPMTSFHEDSSYFDTQEDNGSILCSPIEIIEDFRKEPCSKNDSPLKTVMHGESFIIEDRDDHLLLKDSIGMLSGSVSAENESLKVINDYENSDSLFMNAEKDLILEYFHLGNNAAANLNGNADFKEGSLESSFSPCFESFRFRSHDSHLILEVPICEKLDNNLLLEFQSFTFNELDEHDISHFPLESFVCRKFQNNMQPESELLTFMENEDDSSCLKTGNQPMQRFVHFDDEICNYDKVKVHEERLLSHDKDAEINTQFVNYPAETWRGTSLYQEE